MCFAQIEVILSKDDCDKKEEVFSMKTLKKTLALLLVLVMMMSVFTVAFATDDASDNIDEDFQLKFDDVGEAAYYYRSVLWAVMNGITNGIDAFHFLPEKVCSRAEAVTFLWRIAGSPEPTTTEPQFVDVPQYTFYYKAVLWAAENGITLGMDETHFDPSGILNRAQFVTLLYRYMGSEEVEGESPFADVQNADAWYYDAVVWAYQNGITNGIATDDGEREFRGSDACTRAMTITFLYRAFADAPAPLA